MSGHCTYNIVVRKKKLLRMLAFPEIISFTSEQCLQSQIALTHDHGLKQLEPWAGTEPHPSLLDWYFQGRDCQISLTNNKGSSVS